MTNDKTMENKNKKFSTWICTKNSQSNVLKPEDSEKFIDM